MKNKKKNINKIKEEKYRTEEQQELLRFIKILVIVVVFILAIYFVTKIFVRKELTNDNKETNVTEVDYSKMVFGTMLNRPYEEYYVLAYSSEDNKANYYGALGDSYATQENSLNIYYIDLDDSLNKEFIAEDGKTNPKAKSIDELSVGDITLIKIKDSKIVKYIEDVEEIKSELSIK